MPLFVMHSGSVPDAVKHTLSSRPQNSKQTNKKTQSFKLKFKNNNLPRWKSPASFAENPPGFGSAAPVTSGGSYVILLRHHSVNISLRKEVCFLPTFSWLLKASRSRSTPDSSGLQDVLGRKVKSSSIMNRVGR